MKRKHFLTHTITEDKKRYDTAYIPNQQRAMTTYTFNGTEQEKKIYCGREYEKNLTTNTHYNYIYVGNDPIAVYIQNDSNRLYFLYTNHNGSIEKITNTKGDVVDAMSYTPFGKRRMSANWHYNDTAKHLIDRGFTGQQHLDNFALINFNGRMYDPVLAHFLSPDPYIQSPENPLNHNRYSYCLFSPLQYVDPSGEIFWKPDENGNLVAEKGDNAQTLAIYLNTSIEIAKKMLKEQGFFTDDKDNLKIGDIFQIDYGNISTLKQDLKFWGNNIRKQAQSGIAQDLFTIYWTGKGDVELSSQQFAGILMYLKENNIPSHAGEKIVLKGTSGTLYDGSKYNVNFYGSDIYANAFGRATIYTNEHNNIVGFYDKYDFNSQPFGTRSLKNEIKTRVVRILSPSSAYDFSIRYGYSNRK